MLKKTKMKIKLQKNYHLPKMSNHTLMSRHCPKCRRFMGIVRNFYICRGCGFKDEV